MVLVSSGHQLRATLTKFKSLFHPSPQLWDLGQLT